MTHFSHIIFDLDGTLTDNTHGIWNSLKYALEKMNVHDYSEELLEHFIGPPLQQGFSHLLGMNERNTRLAVEYFREYYSENGWHQNEPYPGIRELLEELHFRGDKMYVATAKFEKFAQKIIRHFEMDKYISYLKGADYSGENGGKATIIGDVIKDARLPSGGNTVMVGDTVYDIEGGKAHGLTTIAVTYGFGKEHDLLEAGPDYLVHSVEELFEMLV